MELKRREFENLRQNDMPVLRYVRDFSILSRYAIDEVDTDEKRQKRFMKGLNPYMKMQLRLARPKEFQELVNVAITFEDDYRNVQEESSYGTQENSISQANTQSQFQAKAEK